MFNFLRRSNDASIAEIENLTAHTDIIDSDNLDKLQIVEDNNDIESNVITTTEEEAAIYGIVIGLLYTKVDPDRIVLRDLKTKCTILLDGSRRKPLLWLYVEKKNKYVITFQEGERIRHDIDGINDIIKLKKHLVATLLEYAENDNA